jgi:triosephosphate isomerase
LAVKTPVLFINFKTYAESTGARAVALAKVADKVSKKTKASIVLVVQPTDISAVSSAAKLGVFAQHVDPVDYGANTGHILPEAVKAAGATGTVLNHAENKRDNKFIEAATARAHCAGLAVMCCAESEARACEIALFNEKPEFIAIEPPELIGGNVSVSTAKPELIANTVKAVKAIAPGISIITGAGIKTSQDVSKALELGTKGVFLASAVVKSKTPEQVLMELVSGLK